MGRLAQRRDVAGRNETAVQGQVTTANDEMRGGLAARRLTVALPLYVVGELHRQHSKLRVRTLQRARPPDGLTRTGNPAA